MEGFKTPDKAMLEMERNLLLREFIEELDPSGERRWVRLELDKEEGRNNGDIPPSRSPYLQ